jgi:hypothetical protein
MEDDLSGVRDLATALIRNETLRSLNLMNTMCPTSSNSSPTAAVSHAGDDLTIFDMPIQKEGGERKPPPPLSPPPDPPLVALGTALHLNSTLNSVNLSENGVCPAGCFALIKAGER